jgi:hypothetical protein
MFADSKIPAAELLKLVLLYILRYETSKDNKISDYVIKLSDRLPPEDVKVRSLACWLGCALLIFSFIKSSALILATKSEVKSTCLRTSRSWRAPR